MHSRRIVPSILAYSLSFALYACGDEEFELTVTGTASMPGSTSDISPSSASNPGNSDAPSPDDDSLKIGSATLALPTHSASDTGNMPSSSSKSSSATTQAPSSADSNSTGSTSHPSEATASNHSDATDTKGSTTESLGTSISSAMTSNSAEDSSSASSTQSPGNSTENSTGTTTGSATGTTTEESQDDNDESESKSDTSTETSAGTTTDSDEQDSSPQDTADSTGPEDSESADSEDSSDSSDSPPLDPRILHEMVAGSVHTRIDASSYEDWIRLDLDAPLRDPAHFDQPFRNGVWDLSFQRFHIKMNGGYNGDAGVEALWLAGDTVYPSLEQTPEGDFSRDWKPAPRDFGYFFQDWYDYNFVEHLLDPKPGTYVVRSSAGRYFKIELLNYYYPEQKIEYAGHTQFRWSEITAP